MELRILIDGKYNNRDNKAVMCKVGDVLETGDGYGSVLITDGLAESVDKKEEKQVQKTQAKIKKQAEEGKEIDLSKEEKITKRGGKTIRGSKTTRKNEFLP